LLHAGSFSSAVQHFDDVFEILDLPFIPIATKIKKNCIQF